MRLSQVTDKLLSEGYLGSRKLFSYATAVGSLSGKSFQNLIGLAFQDSALTLFSAKTDGSVGDVLLAVPYDRIQLFRQTHRFLYSYTEFAVDNTHLRFYNYNKKVFRQGFANAGLEDKS